MTNNIQVEETVSPNTISVITSQNEYMQWLDRPEDMHCIIRALFIKIENTVVPKLKIGIDEIFSRCNLLNELHLSGVDVELAESLAESKSNTSTKLEIFEIEHEQFTPDIRTFCSKTCPKLRYLELTNNTKIKEDTPKSISADEFCDLLRMFPGLVSLGVFGEEMNLEENTTCELYSKNEDVIVSQGWLVDMLITTGVKNLSIKQIIINTDAVLYLQDILFGLPRVKALDIVACGGVQYHGEYKYHSSNLTTFKANYKMRTPELLSFLSESCPKLECLAWTTEAEAESFDKLSDKEVSDTLDALPSLVRLEYPGRTIMFPSLHECIYVTQDKIDGTEGAISYLDYLSMMGVNYMGIKNLHISSVKGSVDLGEIFSNLPLLQKLVISDAIVTQRKHKYSHLRMISVQLEGVSCSLQTIKNISIDCPKLQLLSLSRMKFTLKGMGRNVLDLPHQSFVLSVGSLRAGVNEEFCEVEVEEIPQEDVVSGINSSVHSSDMSSQNISERLATAGKAYISSVHTSLVTRPADDLEITAESGNKKRKLGTSEGPDATQIQTSKPKKLKRRTAFGPVIVVKTRSSALVQPMTKEVY